MSSRRGTAPENMYGHFNHSSNITVNGGVYTAARRVTNYGYPQEDIVRNSQAHEQDNRYGNIPQQPYQSPMTVPAPANEVYAGANQALPPVAMPMPMPSLGPLAAQGSGRGGRQLSTTSLNAHTLEEMRLSRVERYTVGDRSNSNDSNASDASMKSVIEGNYSPQSPVSDANTGEAATPVTPVYADSGSTSRAI